MALESSSGRGGSDGSCASVREALPISSEVDAGGLGVADDQLGRPAADVDHEAGPRSRPRRRGRPTNVNRGLLVRGQHAQRAAEDLGDELATASSALAASRAAAVATVATSGTPCSSISAR